jgi:hypothetical protein
MSGFAGFTHKSSMSEESKAKIREKFDDDKSPLNLFLYNPMLIVIYKTNAIRYNEDYKTLELRIFDMPTTLAQHILHYDVAMAIYKYCFRVTNKNKLLKLKFTEDTGYKLTEVEAINSFKKAMKTLHIAPNRTRNMLFNIRTRYEWNRELNSNINYLYNSDYLK